MPFWTIIVSLFRSRKSSKPAKPSFRLTSLPDVARIHIIRLMDIQDQIRLALSSRKMEQYISFVNIKKTVYREIDLKGDEFCIHDSGTLLLECKGKKACKEIGTVVKTKELKPWLKKDSTVIQNATNVFQRLRKVFPCDFYGVVINLEDRENINLKEIIESSLVRDCTFVSFYKGEVTAEEMDLIMGTWRNGKEIEIESTVLPLEYSHENAFKFNQIKYDHAHWITLESLLSLKNSWKTRIGKNHFKNEDMNIILKHWVSSDHDTTRTLYITITEETNRSKILDGLLILKRFHFGKPYYFLLVDPTKSSRKYPIISCSLNTNLITICTWSRKERFSRMDNQLNLEYTTPLTREYEILKLLHKKKGLEKKLIEMEGMENAEKKRNLEGSIRKVTEELMINGVYYVQGMPVVD